ncbi:MAG: hypothetical protein R2857_06075 [Vampirovibrionales bacterium]
MGMTLVRRKDGKTVGILTDGDVRRILMQDTHTGSGLYHGRSRDVG